MSKTTQLISMSSLLNNLTEKEYISTGDRLKICRYCSGSMQYFHSGIFVCRKCGHEELSDFGKIKQYLNEHGPTPAHIISIETGVDLSTINELLRQSRIEITETSEVFIHCEVCGGEIRSGKICPLCLKQTGKNIANAYTQFDVGEVPKKSLYNKDQQLSGKLRYMSERYNLIRTRMSNPKNDD